jgi:polyisoprenoid-binding protein YceI
MKLKNMFLLVAGTAILASCGSKSEEVEAVTYAVDVKESNVNWRGAENDQHFHTGTVAFAEGTLTMTGEEVTGGTFAIDMNSIVANTEGYPAEKLEYLTSHLKDTDFFLVTENPKVTVEVKSYKDGKMQAVFNVLGASIEQEVPVTLTTDEKGATIKGKFKLDISSVNMPYAKEINEETGKPALQPELEFDMNVVLKK